MGKDLIVLKFRQQFHRELELASGIVTRGQLMEVVHRLIAARPGYFYQQDHKLLERLGIDVTRDIYIGGYSLPWLLEFRGYRLWGVRQKNVISVPAIPRFQVIDVLAILRKVPVSKHDDIVCRYKSFLAGLSLKEKKEISLLVRAYPPGTRAELALMMKSIDERKLYTKIVETVNPAIVHECYMRWMFIEKQFGISA